MAYTNIKTEIDGKIYTNILREITGDILNEVLKKMVDSLGKGYRYMGILEPDGSRPSGDENMFMVATEAGYYTALADDIPSGITICSFSEGSIRVETILNLDEIFSGNHSWGGNNTFNGFTQFQNEVDVSFENVYDLEDGETLSNKLASLVTAIATKISKVTGAVEDNLATFDENGNVKDSGVSVDDLAKKDGISEKLVSGSARGILSPSAIEELFLFQRTANGAGGTGAAVFQSIKGNSIVWNQLVGADTTEVTIPSGHKYVSIIAGVSALATSDGTPISVTGGTDCVFDLTQMGLADLTLAQFQALYPPMAYSPNSGAIKNNCATGMVTDGFNQWDEVTEKGQISFTNGANLYSDNSLRSKNYIRVIPGASYYFKASASIWATGYDANKNYVGGLNNNYSFSNQALTIPANVYYIRFWWGPAYGVTYKNDACINLSGSRNGEYEPHWSDTTALPITTATGKLNGEGESVVLSPKGIPSLGAIANKYIAEKGVLTKYDKQLGVYVFTGTESWNAYGSSGAKAITVEGLGGKTYDAGVTPNILSDVPLAVNNRNTIYTGGAGIAISGNTIYVSDSTKVSAGMQLIYELATPQLYVLDTPVPVVAQVDESGTQTILPQGVDENGTPMTAPFKASIQYPVKLGVAPIGQQSLVNLLERMKSAGKIASYTMVWDATTGVYDFTIS